MNTTLLLLIVLFGLAAVVLGLLLARQYRENARLRSAKNDDEATLTDLRQRLSTTEALHAEACRTRDKVQSELTVLRDMHLRTETELSALRASSQAEIATLRSRNAEDRAAERSEREKLEEQFRQQFKNLATEILNEQTRTFKQTNRESIDLLLKPFRDNITDFRERIERIYSHENEQHGELKNELKRLMELNQRISTDARNLTDALKGNSKVQGDWGEMLLETILDSSSLSKGIHYQTQYNVKDPEGHNLRPDVVLNLPDDKHIIIDSKVSLTAFVNYTAATSDDERQSCLKAHVASVRQHVRELGNKEYQRLLKSPDFVIMFIPNEPAFLAALQSDPKIWSEAYAQKVIISSPTNLFALLKLVADLWKYNDQDKNTRDIADLALKLYDQLVKFTASLESVGGALDKARTAYADAYKRLCTPKGQNSIIRIGEQLRKTAHLQPKQQHSAQTLELAEADTPEAETSKRIGASDRPEPGDSPDPAAAPGPASSDDRQPADEV